MNDMMHLDTQEREGILAHTEGVREHYFRN